MRDMFRPFTLNVVVNFDVVWEQRLKVKSKYKSECTLCGTQFPPQTERPMFVLVPEATASKRNPFYFVICCDNCLTTVRQKIEAQFKPLSEASRAFYDYEVERALRDAGLKFIPGT